MKPLSLSGLAMLFLSLFVAPAFGQNAIIKPNRILPSYISLEENGKRVTSDGAIGFLFTEYKLNPKNSFQLLNSFDDELGYTHKRYIQYYENHQVEGSMVIVHERNGAAYSINGDAFRVQEIKQHTQISEQAASQVAFDYFKADTYFWQQDTAAFPAQYAKYKVPPTAELVWAPENGNFSNPLRLAFKFDIYSIKPLKKELVYIDAVTGALLWTRNSIEEISVPGSALTLFSGTQAIINDSLTPTSFRLRDGTRGNGVNTWNMNGGTSTSSAVDFTNNSNYWSNNINLNRAAYDAHWGTEKAYDYYLSQHNRNSFDNSGGTMNSYVHYSTAMVNAFWDGTAFYYGDGSLSQGFNPMTCIEIVGHEYTHGVTMYSANLIYSYESGALNESFSDIFGQCLEFHNKPSTATWKLGEEADVNGQGIRNMANPNVHSHPDTYLGQHWYTGSWDNGGVHTNSGVQNFWFYVLAAGDTGINDLSSAYSVPGLGITNAAKIAYRNLTVYLTPSSQFADARFYSIQATKDLFGNCSPEVKQTTNAWYAAGVGDSFHTAPPVSFVASPQNSCTAPVTVQFNNTTSNTISATWYFGDGTSSTLPNPSHVYTALGQYTVKLVVTRCNNAADSVTYTNFIVVNPASSFCDTTIFTTSTTQMKTSCTGVIVDNGGASGNYSDNVNSKVILNTWAGAHYRLRFISFDLESGWDYLSLYDGPNTSAPQIGNYTGFGLPNGGNWIYTTGHQFTLEFYTDGSVTYPGFVIEYECIVPLAANFHATDSSGCSAQVAFVNTTTPAVNSYNWSFGDGSSSNLPSPTHTYAASGIYNVSLIACAGSTCDTLVKPVEIAPIQASATIPATAVKGQPFAVTSTTAGATNRYWYVDGLPSGNNITENITVNTGGVHLITHVVTNGTCFDTMAQFITIVYPDGISSVSQLDALSVYPNPAQEYLRIEGTTAGAAYIMCSLVNSLGQQVVAQKEVPAYNGRVSASIDLRDLSPGVYYLNLISEDGATTFRKIIVAKR